ASTAPMEGSVPAAEPPQAHDERHERAVAILLALAAVAGVALGARATLLEGDATDLWQSAVRQEIKRAAASVEDVRFVYAAEGPQVFAIDVARLRAEELRRAAGRAAGETQTELRLEARTFSEYVRQTARPPLPVSRRYLTATGGFDAARRLADNRRRYPDLVAIDPDRPQERGDDLGRRAIFEMAATIPAALAFFLGALSQVFRRPRRPFLLAGAVSLATAVAAGIVLEVVSV
ncbi:MAG: hypothetical protein ABR521_02990, partial [Gaiellaceae bacterium]